MSEISIATYLEKACPSPKSLRTKDGADALVLGLHCLMVDGGFITLNPKDVPIKGFAPPSNWREHLQEWIIPYTRHGAVSTFVLRCSLQEATGRLFIHASETGPDNMPRRENIQVLGLQLANYTSKERCESKSWEDVIQNERTLMEMFREFVSRPLWESSQRDLGAADDEEDAENAGGNGANKTSSAGDGTVVSTTNGAVSSSKSDKSSSKLSKTMSRVGITRKNVLMAALVGSGAAMVFYMHKNHKETGKYIPEGVAERFIPAFLRK